MGDVSVLQDYREHNLGNYKFLVELSDGTKIEQVGVLHGTNPQEDTEVNEIMEMLQRNSLTVTGSYSWREGGYLHIVEYIADKSGYRPRLIKTIREDQIPIPVVIGSPPILQTISQEPITDLPPLKTIASSLFSSPSEPF